MNYFIYFGATLIGTIFGFWTSKIYLITKTRLRENALLEELRKLCNELLKIKNKGTIVITKLSVSEGKGPNHVVITTFSKEGFKEVKNGLCSKNIQKRNHNTN